MEAASSKRVYADSGVCGMIQGMDFDNEPYQIGRFYSEGGWPEPKMIRISDLRDPSDPQGRTYREVNSAKKHKYPIGTLVELNHGARLWVVHHARDCDQTPLYCLSADPNDTEVEREGFYNASWVKGIPEESLTFIRNINAPEML